MGVSTFDGKNKYFFVMVGKHQRQLKPAKQTTDKQLNFVCHQLLLMCTQKCLAASINSLQFVFV